MALWASEEHVQRCGGGEEHEGGAWGQAGGGAGKGRAMGGGQAGCAGSDPRHPAAQGARVESGVPLASCWMGMPGQEPYTP